MAKKRRRKKKSKKFFSKQTLFLVLLFTLAPLVGAAGVYLYFLGFEAGVQQAKEQHKAALVKTQKKSLQPSDKKNKSTLDKKEKEPKLSEIEDFRANQKVEEPSKRSPATSQRAKSKQQKQSPLASLNHRPSLGKKPKLVIIIDDVAFGYQVQALKNLHLPVTLSFFPPSPRHPNTPKYAKSFEHYMIHLPLEAMHFRAEELDTLHVISSFERMDRVIKGIRKNFPKAKYLNNHTGSKFTADLAAVRRLISILDRYGFVLVDSRTTPFTKIPKVMHELQRPYLARDIFLDNKLDVQAIKKQLQKAVHLAKKRGYAIAIGHPHKKTIEALRQSKGILKQVEVVYIDKLGIGNL